jgi:hypothetical protein
MMLRKILIGLLIGASVLWFLSGAAIDFLYFSNLPRVLDEKTGHIFRVVVSHGSVRFATAREVGTLQLMKNGLPVAGLVFVSTLLLGLRLGVLHVRNSSTRAGS